MCSSDLELAETAFSLSPGQTSEPINASDAVYLMLVEGRKPSQAKALTDVRGEIEKTLRSQQQDRLQKTWIAGLKKKTFVHYFPE
mgnify:CR=1 FL=1